MVHLGFDLYAKRDLTLTELCEVGWTGLALFVEKTFLGRWFIRRRALRAITYGRRAGFLDVIRYEKRAFESLDHVAHEAFEVSEESVKKTAKQIWDLADIIAIKKGLLTPDVMRSFTVDQAQEHLKGMLWEELMRKLDLAVAHHNPQSIFDEIEKFKVREDKRAIAEQSKSAPRIEDKVVDLSAARTVRTPANSLNAIEPAFRPKRRQPHA